MCSPRPCWPRSRHGRRRRSARSAASLDDGNGVSANGGSGIIPVAGWALDDNGVQNVDIMVDGIVAGPGLLRHVPRRECSPVTRASRTRDLPGFGFQLDTTHFLNGMHTVTAAGAQPLPAR